MKENIIVLIALIIVAFSVVFVLKENKLKKLSVFDVAQYKYGLTQYLISKL